MTILDKKIKPGKKPLTCLDVDQAREFEGKKCFMASGLSYFNDLSRFEFEEIKPFNASLGKLLVIDDFTDHVFYNAETKLAYRYVLPCEWVESEEQYRAYTLEEFIEAMESGLFESWIKMRHAITKKQCDFLYTGYQETEAGDYICLGCYQFDFISLFKNYEIQDLNGKWHPFGVLEL